MGHYPFPLFNAMTGLGLALTLMLVWRRFRGSLAANWALVCYALIAGYTIGFSGGLNPYWVAAGVACAVAIRFGLHPRRMLWGGGVAWGGAGLFLFGLPPGQVGGVEAVPPGSVAWRCVGLLLMW